MFIEHKNIMIRNAKADDAAQLAKWWNDGSIMAHAGFPNGLNMSAEKVKIQISCDSDSTVRRLIIEENGQTIGEMVFRIKQGNTAEIGVKICDFSRQNIGIGKIALSMLIKALFKTGIARIVLDTDLENKRAQHVYEEIGFKMTGIRTDAWRNQIGQLRSAVDYELHPHNFIDFAV